MKKNFNMIFGILSIIFISALSGIGYYFLFDNMNIFFSYSLASASAGLMVSLFIAFELKK